jgi:hypothetical protein
MSESLSLLVHFLLSTFQPTLHTKGWHGGIVTCGVARLPVLRVLMLGLMLCCYSIEILNIFISELSVKSNETVEIYISSAIRYV